MSHMLDIKTYQIKLRKGNPMGNQNILAHVLGLWASAVVYVCVVCCFARRLTIIFQMSFLTMRCTCDDLQFVVIKGNTFVSSYQKKL